LARTPIFARTVPADSSLLSRVCLRLSGRVSAGIRPCEERSEQVKEPDVACVGLLVYGTRRRVGNKAPLGCHQGTTGLREVRKDASGDSRKHRVAPDRRLANPAGGGRV